MNSDPSPGDAYYVVLAAFAAQMVVTTSDSTPFGAAAVGWNGLFLAEVARRSPRGMVSVATSAAMTWILAASAQQYSRPSTQ